MRRIPLAAVAAIFLPGTLHAQAAPVPANQVTEQIDNVGEAKKDSVKHDKDKKKSRDILIVSIPHSSPSLGSGLTLMAGVFYNPNNSPEPWVTGIGARYTSNKSWALGAAHKMSLANDRFRLAIFAGLASINVNFYGIGAAAGSRNLAIQLNEKGAAAAVQGKVRLATHFYVGARYEFLHLTTSIRRDKPVFPDADIPTAEFSSKLSGIAPVVSYDSRDSSMMPHRGEFAVLSAMVNRQFLGSSYNYAKYTINGNVYRPPGKNTAVAARLSACQTSTGAPFFDICMYGSRSDLRGYEAGRFRNRAYWAGQAELRQHLFGRFGAVAFAGIGQSSEHVTDFRGGTWLPAAGTLPAVQEYPSQPSSRLCDREGQQRTLCRCRRGILKAAKRDSFFRAPPSRPTAGRDPASSPGLRLRSVRRTVPVLAVPDRTSRAREKPIGHAQTTGVTERRDLQPGAWRSMGKLGGSPLFRPPRQGTGRGRDDDGLTCPGGARKAPDQDVPKSRSRCDRRALRSPHRQR